MKRLMTCLALGTFATLVGVASSPMANAQSDTDRSEFTVTEPLEVGSFTLPPGTYVIRVVELESSRNTIQVTNADQTKVFATVLAIPHPILVGELAPSSRYIYYKTAPGQTKALRTWFARNTTNGQDIVYPKRRAMELAAAAKEPVIFIPDEAKETEYKTVPLIVVTPDQTLKPYEAPVVVVQKAPEPAPVVVAVQKAPEPAPVVVAEASPEKELPRTASHVPLYAALGLLSLGAAIGLRAFANRTA
jgi:hypothetical protein